MSPETKAKLDEVLRRKAAHETAAEIEQKEREEAQRRKDAEREAMQQRWVQAKHEIVAATEVVNAQVDGAGLKFSTSEKPRAADQPGLGQLAITLEDGSQTKPRQLIFNVSAYGLVQPVTLIPHTGPKIGDFKITEADQPKYEAVLVEFLDICFAANAK